MVYQSNIYEFLENGGEGKELLICKDDKEAKQVADVVTLLGYDTFILPDIRVSVGEDLRAYSDEVYLFLSTLQKYHESERKKVLVSPVRTTLLPFPKPELFARKTIEFGETLDLNMLKEELYHWGYHFTDITASRGEVSFRGDIIDIFPIQSEVPYRISLFDEEVESIHHFDATTQKRLGDELEDYEITPAFLALDETA